MEKISPAFPYPGGKSRLLKHILPLIPEHAIYVEPFAGGLAVLLAKKRAKTEVVNDLDKEIVNFYRCLRSHKTALINEIGGSARINSREDFTELLAPPAGDATDLQRAARWFVVRVCSYGGQSECWGRSLTGYHGWEATRHEAAISRVSERLQRVFIENRDWEEIVTRFDSPDTFFYFDPPYVNASVTAYHPFSYDEMKRIRNRLDKLQGTWLLSCDDSPSCREIFAGLPVRELKIGYTLGSRYVTRKQAGELLVFHPKLAHLPHA
ncbi:MAG: DNA adenine methylase [Puniceicoccales bacterium]|jgi:DNA adenine methylase|nr:DNA adenine methylase [Puniceicoccales bacterium]